MPKVANPRPSDSPHKIKDVVALTGVSREAIRFYINEGLLPAPIKTSHNMAWYSDRHVERLQLIQKLQTERFLPLKAIKALLDGTRDLDLTPGQHTAMEEMRRRVVTEHRDFVLTDAIEDIAQTMGLSPLEQDDLIALGLGRDGRLTLSDVEIVRRWIVIRDAGLTLERGFRPLEMKYLWEAVDIAFRAELEIFLSHVDALDRADAARVVDVVIPALSRIFGLLHERRLAAFVVSAPESAPDVASALSATDTATAQTPSPRRARRPSPASSKKVSPS